MNIEDRIAKLLAVAEGTANEHESSLAAQRAAELMQEFNINEAMLGRHNTDDIIKAELWKCPTSAVPGHLGPLISACKALFGIKVILVSEYLGTVETPSPYGVRYGTRRRRKYGKAHIAVGRAQAIMAARQALSLYLQAIERGVRKSGVRGRSEFRAYRIGSASCIRTRAIDWLESRQADNANMAPMAIILSDQRAVDDEFKRQFPNTRRLPAIRVHRGASYTQGFHDGHNIGLANEKSVGGTLALGDGS